MSLQLQWSSTDHKKPNIYVCHDKISVKTAYLRKKGCTLQGSDFWGPKICFKKFLTETWEKSHVSVRSNVSVSFTSLWDQSRDFYGNLATRLLGKITWKSRKIWLRFHALLSHFAYNNVNPALLAHVCFNFLFSSTGRLKKNSWILLHHYNCYNL